MAISLPSRTEAIMPHPHEQKLHEVVNSLIFESFSFCVAALIVGTSMRLPRASPTPPPTLALNQSLRVISAGPLKTSSFCAFKESAGFSFVPVDIAYVPYAPGWEAISDSNQETTQLLHQSALI